MDNLLKDHSQPAPHLLLETPRLQAHLVLGKTPLSWNNQLRATMLREKMSTQGIYAQPESERQQLRDAVWGTVGSFFGTGFWGDNSDPKAGFGPIFYGIVVACIYALIPLAQRRWMASSPELIILSWWGTAYYGIVTVFARSTSIATTELVEVLLIPNVSEDFARSAREEMTKGFNRNTILFKSLGVATLAMILSCYLLRRFPGLHLLTWGIGFFGLYFTASQATLTGLFYTCFSNSLKKHSDDLFVVDPAASPAVSACSAIAKRVLAFWFGAFVLVMSLMAAPYKFAYPFAYRLSDSLTGDMFRFIAAVVIIAGFFSFVFGSLVYLRFERDLRVAVDRARLAALSLMQRRYGELAPGEAQTSAEKWARLDRIKSASDYLSRSAPFRSSFQTLGTVAIALLPPLVSIVGAVLTFKKK